MKCVLLEKAGPNHSADFQDQLLILRHQIGPDQLNDLHQIVFLLQQLDHFCAHFKKVASKLLVIPFRHIVDVFAVARQPVDCRIMPGVRQLPVQPPEAAYKALCILCNRFGKIASLRRYGADNGNASLCVIVADDSSRPAVKFRKTRRQICWEPFLSRHFFQAPGDLTQRLRPS